MAKTRFYSISIQTAHNIPLCTFEKDKNQTASSLCLDFNTKCLSLQMLEALQSIFCGLS